MLILWTMLLLLTTVERLSIDVETRQLPDLRSGIHFTRAFTATDDCGNATSATQDFNFIDTTSPELTVPESYTAECSDEHPMDQGCY